MQLTDKQWEAIRECFPAKELRGTTELGGRPFRDPRDVLNGVLWVLRTCAPWADMPGRYPPGKTCHRRFQRWVEEGVMEKILRHLAEHLREVGGLDLTEAYIDGSHAGAKRGDLVLGVLEAASKPRSWQWRTATVFLSPLGSKVVKDMKHHSSK